MCLPRTGSVCLFRTTAASCARGVVFFTVQFDGGIVPTGSERGSDTLHIAQCKKRHWENGKKIGHIH